MKNTVKIISILSAAALCSATAFAESSEDHWYDTIDVRAASNSKDESNSKAHPLTSPALVMEKTRMPWI